jgi:hypothetical protein
MEAENNNTKEYNDQENNETEEKKPKKLISIENVDLSNKSQIINSPRSLEACLRVGIEPSELYKLNMDEFKKKYPDVKELSEDLLKYRYDAEEKFRRETLEQVKQERIEIIENEKQKKEEEIKNKEKLEKIANDKKENEDKDKEQ